MADVVYGRSPLEVRDEMILNLFEEFGKEMEQLGITLDELLEKETWEFDVIKRKIWQQVKKNLNKEHEARERYHHIISNHNLL